MGTGRKSGFAGRLEIVETGRMEIALSGRQQVTVYPIVNAAVLIRVLAVLERQ